MISYSQNHEDVLLSRLFAKQKAGFYVDVGAYHPLDCSVTRAFHERGWRGINIEPGSIYSFWPTHRPNDINLNVAVSDQSGTFTYYEYPAMPAVSRLSDEIPDTLTQYSEGRVSKTVPVLTLREIFKKHWPAEGVDFMSIDVEGHEEKVIRGNDWGRYRPRALVIEATLPFSATPCHQGWEPLLIQAGYLFCYFDGLNRYYLRKEDRQLQEHFQVPVNLFDDYTSAEVMDLREKLHAANVYGQQKDHTLAVVSEELHRTRGELGQIQARLAGTGDRALEVGLKVARLLSRLKPGRKLQNT
ncbi:MAG: FkbM family methyltransferase [Gemmataceae bacterium]